MVIDTNAVLSAVIAQSASLDLIFNEGLELIAREFIEVEIKEHHEEIREKAVLSDAEMSKLLEAIFDRIDVYGREHYAKLKDEARQVSPDEDDTPFFALALRENCPVWSNDKLLKKQNRVKVFNTSELIELLAPEN